MEIRFLKILGRYLRRSDTTGKRYTSDKNLSLVKTVIVLRVIGQFRRVILAHNRFDYFIVLRDYLTKSHSFAVAQ